MQSQRIKDIQIPTERLPKEYSGIYTLWSKSARNKTKTNAEINQGTNQLKPNVEMNIRDMTYQILVRLGEAFRTKGILSCDRMLIGDGMSIGRDCDGLGWNLRDILL
jgi:hypothetical protein